MILIRYTLFGLPLIEEMITDTRYFNYFTHPLTEEEKTVFMDTFKTSYLTDEKMEIVENLIQHTVSNLYMQTYKCRSPMKVKRSTIVLNDNIPRGELFFATPVINIGYALYEIKDDTEELVSCPIRFFEEIRKWFIQYQASILSRLERLNNV